MRGGGNENEVVGVMSIVEHTPFLGDESIPQMAGSGPAPANQSAVAQIQYRRLLHAMKYL